MTTRYTNDEWTTLIRQTEKCLRVNQLPCPYAPVYTAGFAQYFDHTILKVDTTPQQVDKLCGEARMQGFKSVCVRLNHVQRAASNLRGTKVAVVCVIGFPEGTQSMLRKTREVQAAIAAGATELDMVLNYNLLLHSSYEAAFQEIATIRSLAPAPTVLKVIIEVSQLTPYAIIAGCVLAANAQADFVKTSTGFVGRGATVDDVRLMRAAAAQATVSRGAGIGSAGNGERGMGDSQSGRAVLQVKASGGIRSLSDAVRMLEAGASRIGATACVWIMQEVKEEMERRNRSLGGDEVAKLGITRLYSDDSAGY